MTLTSGSDVYYDRYDFDIDADPHLDEVLQRFPEWDVDWEHAKMARTSTVRGWESLPVRTAVN